MSKIIDFPSKPKWVEKLKESLKYRYGTEEAPEEVGGYLESVIDEVVTRSKIKYVVEATLYGNLPQSEIIKLNDAVDELAQNLANHFRDQVIGYLIAEITDLRLRIYELEHAI